MKLEQLQSLDNFLYLYFNTTYVISEIVVALCVLPEVACNLYRARS